MTAGWRQWDGVGGGSDEPSVAGSSPSQPWINSGVLRSESSGPRLFAGFPELLAVRSGAAECVCAGKAAAGGEDEPARIRDSALNVSTSFRISLQSASSHGTLVSCRAADKGVTGKLVETAAAVHDED